MRVYAGRGSCVSVLLVDARKHIVGKTAGAGGICDYAPAAVVGIEKILQIHRVLVRPRRLSMKPCRRYTDNVYNMCGNWCADLV